jgi:hypothetical protein
MSSDGTTPPVNPAKGPKRGQTTLAAEIDRWQTLADNLAPQIDQMPGLAAPFAQFQTLLASAKGVRNQLNTLRADTDSALAQRDEMLVDGGALFARLTLGLQSIHGPRSPRLREFGLKPRKTRARTRSASTPPPPTPEVTEVTEAAVVTTAHPPALPATPAASPGK